MNSKRQCMSLRLAAAQGPLNTVTCRDEESGFRNPDRFYGEGTLKESAASQPQGLCQDRDGKQPS